MAALKNDQIKSNFVMHGNLQIRMHVGVVVSQPECCSEFVCVPVFSLSNCIRTFQWQIQDFPEEEAPTPGGRQPIIWPIFPKNCMKMKKFWARSGGTHPLC